ncbi:hypothetical protein ACD591_10065 [Rufibacter glacialis]|uniref:Uncharacterized protein n=1 Tax=Rufibacter glacialis TaxID=1259555 RepID=A0A5M8Q7H7_9BACT|nr:hypothetical protein [Rufibacter glacialis]KAA6431885.1 hypothetical protein FOE74_17410 [Rufibacter glacialis]GGK80703.1 hypothetical protein GCM10011405_30590 [Rufibacter glacialis]
MRPIKNRHKKLATMIISNVKRIRVFNLFDEETEEVAQQVIEYIPTGETMDMEEVFIAMDKLVTPFGTYFIHPDGRMFLSEEFANHLMSAKQEYLSTEEFERMKVTAGDIFTMEKVGSKKGAKHAIGSSGVYR